MRHRQHPTIKRKSSTKMTAMATLTNEREEEGRWVSGMGRQVGNHKHWKA